MAVHTQRGVLIKPGIKWTAVCLPERYLRCKVDAGRGAAAAPRLMPGGEGILYSKRVKSLADLKSDDEAAAAEQAAQGGKLPFN